MRTSIEIIKQSDIENLQRVKNALAKEAFYSSLLKGTSISKTIDALVSSYVKGFDRTHRLANGMSDAETAVYFENGIVTRTGVATCIADALKKAFKKDMPTFNLERRLIEIILDDANNVQAVNPDYRFKTCVRDACKQFLQDSDNVELVFNAMTKGERVAVKVSLAEAGCYASDRITAETFLCDVINFNL